MKHLPPLLTETRVEAFTASALRFVCWVFGLIVHWGFSGQSRKLRDTLRQAERTVEFTIFLHAVSRFGPLPNRRQRPASAPPGFRIALSRGHLFYKRANIRARKAGIIDRCFALLDALHNPERAIEYFLKRIRKGLRARRFVIAAPLSDDAATTFAPFSQTALDSS